MQAILTLSRDAAHLSLTGIPPAAGAETVATLSLAAGAFQARLGVPRAPGLHEQMSFRLPLAQLPGGGQWPWDAVTLRGDLGQGAHQWPVQVQRLQAALVQRGKVDGIDADGVLGGTSGLTSGSDVALPVSVQIGRDRVFGLTFPQDGKQRFALNLAPFLSQRVRLVQVTGGLENALPFGRARLFAALTPGGVLQAAPVNFVEGIVAGAFRLAGDDDRPLRLELRDGDKFSALCNCNRLAQPDYNFGGVPSGFFLRMPSSFNLETTRVVLIHPSLAEPMEFRLLDFVPSGAAMPRQNQGVA